MINIISAIISIAICTGCSTQATMAVYSQPEGAYITEVGTGKSWGMAPVSVAYNAAALKQHVNSEGCYLVKGFKAQWVSGASSLLDPIKLCGSATGNYNISLAREASHPNLEKDLQFALQVQSINAQRRQAQAASDSAAAALWSAWSTSQQNNINCTSTPIGDSVYTNCK